MKFQLLMDICLQYQSSQRQDHLESASLVLSRKVIIEKLATVRVASVVSYKSTLRKQCLSSAFNNPLFVEGKHRTITGLDDLQ